ncbi:MAG: hypothetical protein LBR40_03865 [Bacilli bacterium]|jgi:hypothetical protein|nr:hypothetical protein [Bacilli bacterium]
MNNVLLKINSINFNENDELIEENTYQCLANYYNDEEYYYLDYYLDDNINTSYHLAYNENEFIIKANSANKKIIIYCLDNTGYVKILTHDINLIQDIKLIDYVINNKELFMRYGIFDNNTLLSKITFKIEIEENTNGIN